MWLFKENLSNFFRPPKCIVNSLDEIDWTLITLDALTEYIKTDNIFGNNFNSCEMNCDTR